jgi:hypothetical protein
MDDDNSKSQFICPITAYPCEGDLSHLCEEYGCARKGGLSPHSEENLANHAYTATKNQPLILRKSQAKREIATFIALRGSGITDDFEGEIMRQVFTLNWTLHELR